MKECILILQEVSKCPTHAAVVALEHKVILDLKQISPRLIASLLTITAVRTPEVIQVCLLTREEN
jgi:hypothetical protein